MFQIKLLLYVDALCRNNVENAQAVIVPLVITIPHLKAYRPVIRIKSKEQKILNSMGSVLP